MTNIQGNIIGLIDGSGTRVVEYTYDAWGNQTSCTGTLASTLGEANPYRYRGYRVDSETGLYYLQSRYYDTSVGRFVNADDLDFINIAAQSLNIINIYSYCHNNPIKDNDSSGHFIANIISAIIGATISVLADIVAQALGYFFNSNFDLSFRKFILNWWSIGWSFFWELVTGALMVSKLKTGAQVIVGAIIGLVDSMVTMVRTKRFDIQLLLTNVGINIVGALIGGAGIGSKYFSRSMYTSGGLFHYGRWYSSRYLLLKNPNVLKDFGRALAKYISVSFGSALAKIIANGG